MKFDLVHLTVSPCERVGSGDETTVKQRGHKEGSEGGIGC